MTNDQKAALNYLENAIFAPRQKGRIKNIRKEFSDYRATLIKEPLWKRLFKRLFTTRYLQQARRP